MLTKRPAKIKACVCGCGQVEEAIRQVLAETDGVDQLCNLLKYANEHVFKNFKLEFVMEVDAE
jgi:predicted TPR repeat methyltransferase